MISLPGLILTALIPQPLLTPPSPLPPNKLDGDDDIAPPDSSGDEVPPPTKVVALALRDAVSPSPPDAPATDPSSGDPVRVLVRAVPNADPDDPDPTIAMGTLDECPCVRRGLPGIGARPGASGGVDTPSLDPNSCFPTGDCDVLPVDDNGKCDADIDPIPMRIPSADALAFPVPETIPEARRTGLAGDAVGDVADAVVGDERAVAGELARPDVGLVARFAFTGLLARAVPIVGLVARETGGVARSRSRALDADVDAVGLRVRVGDAGGEEDRAAARPAAGAEDDDKVVVDADANARVGVEVPGNGRCEVDAEAPERRCGVEGCPMPMRRDVLGVEVGVGVRVGDARAARGGEVCLGPCDALPSPLGRDMTSGDGTDRPALVFVFVFTDGSTEAGVGEGAEFVCEVVAFGFVAGAGVRVDSKVGRVGDGTQGPGVSVEAEGVAATLVESREGDPVRSVGVGIWEPDPDCGFDDRAEILGATDATPPLKLNFFDVDRNAPSDTRGDRCLLT